MDGWNTILSYWVSAYFQGLLLLVSGRVPWHRWVQHHKRQPQRWCQRYIGENDGVRFQWVSEANSLGFVSWLFWQKMSELLGWLVSWLGVSYLLVGLVEFFKCVCVVQGGLTKKPARLITKALMWAVSSDHFTLVMYAVFRGWKTTQFL